MRNTKDQGVNPELLTTEFEKFVLSPLRGKSAKIDECVNCLV